MAISTSPSELLGLSACYDCIPEDNRMTVVLYILAVIAGLDDQTPSQLLEASACYDCIPEGDQSAVANYLLNQIVNSLP